jgi:hypothetical protein
MPAKNIARFQVVAEQAIDEKFVPVYQEFLLAVGVGGIQIGLTFLRDEPPREPVRFVLGKGPLFLERVFPKS